MRVQEVERWLLKYLQDVFTYSTPNVSIMAVDSNKIVGANISFVMDPSNNNMPPAMMNYLDLDKEPAQIRITKFLDELEQG